MIASWCTEFVANVDFGVPTRDHASAVEHRPAEVVAQPLVIEHQFADRRRELVTLPAALQSPGGIAVALRRGRAYRPDRVGGRTELVRGDVGDGPGLAGGVRGM